jgi:formylglycine-generating enzyme required for sulfatase activity
MALSEIPNPIFSEPFLSGAKGIVDIGAQLYNGYHNHESRKLTQRGQDLQQLQHEERLFSTLYEGRENRQSQAWQHAERLLAQSLENNVSRDQQNRHHKERLLAQLNEGETSRAFQKEILALQQDYQLKIKALDKEWALEMRQHERQLQLELLNVLRQNQHYPLYPGVEGILNHPLKAGLQTVHVLFSPPHLQYDKVNPPTDFPPNEHAMTEALQQLTQLYQQSGRPVRLQGGAWTSKERHGQTAAGAIFERLKSEPILILESSVQSDDFFLKIGHWWENASEYQFRNVLTVSWRALLNEVVKQRVRAWQANQLKHQFSEGTMEAMLGSDAFLAYQESLRLIEAEQNMGEFGFSGFSPVYKALRDDERKLTQWLNAYHQIFVGMLLDDYFLLNPEPKERKSPLLPSLLPTLLKAFPERLGFLNEHLMPHYERVYAQLIGFQTAWAADLNTELASVLLSLEQAQAAERVLEQAFESLWLLGDKNQNAPCSPEQRIADYQNKVSKDDFDWLSMVYEKVEKMPLPRFQGLLPMLRVLRLEAANLQVLFQAETIQREAEAKAAERAAVEQLRREAEAKAAEQLRREAEQKRQEDEAKAKKEAAERTEIERIRKAYEPEMILVEGGTFQMGSDKGHNDEKPIHKVMLSSFSIGKYPITQAQWKAVMGNNPSHFKGDDLPVEAVSHDDIQEFLRKLNHLTGKTYRLPTEAQWEFAARGGNKSNGFKYSGSNNLKDVAWYDENSGGKTHSVGKLAANELGIYDMSGNVCEWCSDWYGSYSSAAVTKPTGAANGSCRVYRGGSWCNFPGFCRPANRGSNTPTDRYSNLGFRLVGSL